VNKHLQQILSMLNSSYVRTNQFAIGAEKDVWDAVAEYYEGSFPYNSVQNEFAFVFSENSCTSTGRKSTRNVSGNVHSRAIFSECEKFILKWTM